MIWLPAILGMVVGVTVSGAVVGMAMKVREKIVVDGAVGVERAAGIVTCNNRVSRIERRHNEVVEEAARRAVEATSGVNDPNSQHELVELCKASASCRSRGSL